MRVSYRGFAITKAVSASSLIKSPTSGFERELETDRSLLKHPAEDQTRPWTGLDCRRTRLGMSEPGSGSECVCS